MTSVSRVPHPKRFDENASLSRQQVIDAALDYIDTYGLTGLSMRGLAKEIGVYPATLYWHAGNKAQLLALLYQQVIEQIELPSVDDTDWRDWIRSFARQVRQALGPHPELSAGFLAQLPISAESLALVDALLRVLSTAGFADGQLVHAYNCVLSCVFGWVAEEFAADPGESDEQWQEEFRRLLDESDALTAVKANLPVLANQAWLVRWTTGPGAPLESGFEFMLETMLAGLERMGAAG